MTNYDKADKVKDIYSEPVLTLAAVFEGGIDSVFYTLLEYAKDTVEAHKYNERSSGVGHPDADVWKEIKKGLGKLTTLSENLRNSGRKS